MAKVTLRGALNGVDFIISRTKTANKGSLAFFLGGEDKTTQSIRDTQFVIDETFGINAQILSRSIFHTQHGANRLLESHDAKLKEELALVVPLAIWQTVVQIARKEGKLAKDKTSQIEGMIEVRTGDLEKLRRRLDIAKDGMAEKERLLTEAECEYNALMSGQNATGAEESSFDNLQKEVSAAMELIKRLEEERSQVVMHKDQSSTKANDNLAEMTRLMEAAKELLQTRQRNLDLCVLSNNAIEERVHDLEKTWNVDLLSGETDLSALPQQCPTCHQPLTQLETHVGHKVRSELFDRFASVTLQHKEGTHKLEQAQNEFNQAEHALNESVARYNEAHEATKAEKSRWSTALQDVDTKLSEARRTYDSASLQLANSMKHTQHQSRLESLQTALSSRRELVDDARQYTRVLEQDVVDAEDLVTELQKKKEEQYRLASLYNDLSEALGQRGVQTFLMQNAIKLLELASQSYLSDMSDGAQQLQISLDSSDRILRRAYIRGPSGEYNERPLASLSGGQWRRCSLALDLGFADLIACRANFQSSLIVLDEPLTHLDRSGRTDVGRVLRKLLQRNQDDNNGNKQGLNVSTVLCILQDLAAEELEEAFDHIDEVVKEGGSSRVLVDEDTM
jgi:DNA repair exonuclease SbcCD ATPase subunit